MADIAFHLSGELTTAFDAIDEILFEVRRGVGYGEFTKATVMALERDAKNLHDALDSAIAELER